MPRQSDKKFSQNNNDRWDAPEGHHIVCVIILVFWSKFKEDKPWTNEPSAQEKLSEWCNQKIKLLRKDYVLKHWSFWPCQKTHNKPHLYQAAKAYMFCNNLIYPSSRIKQIRCPNDAPENLCSWDTNQWTFCKQLKGQKNDPTWEDEVKWYSTYLHPHACQYVTLFRLAILQHKYYLKFLAVHLHLVIWPQHIFSLYVATWSTWTMKP